MVERHEAVMETGLAIGQLKVIDGAARQARLDKIFQVISPKTKTAAQRKREVQFIEQFVTRHQTVEDLPGIAKLNMPFLPHSRLRRENQFASRAGGAKRQERPRGHEGITGLRGANKPAPQKHNTPLALHLGTD